MSYYHQTFRGTLSLDGPAVPWHEQVLRDDGHYVIRYDIVIKSSGQTLRANEEMLVKVKSGTFAPFLISVHKPAQISRYMLQIEPQGIQLMTVVREKEEEDEKQYLSGKPTVEGQIVWARIPTDIILGVINVSPRGLL